MQRLMAVVLFLSLAGFTASGCAHQRPYAKARAAVALGAIATVAGLLIAGGCGEGQRRVPGCGSSNGGHPEVGAPLALAGLATMTAGSAAAQSVNVKGHARVANAGVIAPPPPRSPDPNPTPLMEPLAGTPLVPIVR
jgi:hypothetical protein